MEAIIVILAAFCFTIILLGFFRDKKTKSLYHTIGFGIATVILLSYHPNWFLISTIMPVGLVFTFSLIETIRHYKDRF